MQLTKIELLGFKSFYKKTKIILSKPQNERCGTTVIVGPNGSGKSNICDALKWGLGVQSKKGFRSKKGRDVIFAGSHSKKPLSMASVSLYFDSEGKKSLLRKNEVITRKIYASGENEYFINNNRVKLGDILQKLGQAGIGQQSYSIINQGMADRLLLVNPLERKEIIEEAAKVKHFQIKKDNSLRKMEASKNNLEKVVGLIGEIRPRLNYLEVQAKRKIEQEQLEKELDEKSKRYLGTLWNKLSRKKEGLLEKRKIEEKELETIEKKLENLRRDLSSSRENLKEKTVTKPQEQQDKLEKLYRKENNITKEISVLEGRIEILKEKISFEEATSEQRVDIPYVEKELEKITGEINQLIEKKNFALRSLGYLRDLIQKLKGSITKGVITRDDRSKSRELEEKIMKNYREIKVYRKTLLEILKEKEGLTREITKKSEAEKQNQLNFYKLEKELDCQIRQKEVATEKINTLEIELAKIEVKEGDLRNKVISLLRITPEKINYQGTEDFDTEELGRQVEEIIRKISVCDSINQEVVEEYKETSERYNFLEKESTDLKKTIRSLKKIIKKLELKIEERFDKTFKGINENFNRYFKIIFKGGTAELMKVEIPLGLAESKQDTKVPFKIGIDINAVPPGKRIKNVGMLSGGEKALTSLALLFAIIGISSPPFVVLDEVDAALDEANSARFAKIIKLMSRNTQFIIISHNQEVMKEAQILYGVTMQKDGISRLLSLDLEK